MGTWGATWRLEEVRDFLGHSSIVVTQRYAHLSPEHLHAKAAQTGGAGGGGGLREPNGSVAFAATLRVGGNANDVAGVLGEARTLDRRLRSSISNGVLTNGYQGRLPFGSQQWIPLAQKILGDAVTHRRLELGDVEALALAVLEIEPVRLAQQALEPGPFQARRAVELAAVIARWVTGMVLPAGEKGTP
jgi:hypothetical protein